MTLQRRYGAVRARISEAARASGRTADDVTLVAVSKRQSDDAVRALASLGHLDLGENLVQAWMARGELGLPDIRWHLIGPVQTNKSKFVARGRPALLHTIDRPELVGALDRRLAGQSALDVLIQLNIDDEPQKAGSAPGDLAALADLVSEAETLRLRGLMCIPRPLSQGSPRSAFARTRRLLDRIVDRVEGAPVLSMGMSDDYEDAIAEGSTLVRIGTSLFGPRS